VSMSRLSLPLVVLASAVASSGAAVEELAWQDSGPWRLSERGARSPRRQMALARAVEERGNFKLAEAHYALLIKRYPDSPQAGPAAVGVARSVFLDGRTGEALESLWGALSGYPDEARTADGIELACAIGKIVMDRALAEKPGERAESLEQAVGAFEKVLRLDPSGVVADDALYFLGLARESLGQKEEAAESFARLLSAFPKSRHAAHAKVKLRALGAPPARAPRAEPGEGGARPEETGTAGAADAWAPASPSEDRDAEKGYRRGLYYKRIGKVKAARVYMGLVVRRHSSTKWAKLAAAELKALSEGGDGGGR